MPPTNHVPGPAWVATTFQVAATAGIRYEDVFFESPTHCWTSNGDGQLFESSDSGASWSLAVPTIVNHTLRCLAFADGVGWIGGWNNPTASSFEPFLMKREAGVWKSLVPPPQPVQICGLFALDANTVFAAGTNDPANPPRFLRTRDGGAHWTSIDMSQYADNLIDVLFLDEQNGWVVGGVRRPGAASPAVTDELCAVVLRTADSGDTWQDCLTTPLAQRPVGEWGWKIQRVSATVVVVSIECATRAAILRSEDGGLSFSRIDVAGLQRIQGIGFVDEQHGWIAGALPGGAGGGDGPAAYGWFDGQTWSIAGDTLDGVNRFRFTRAADGRLIGLAAGDTVFQLDSIASSSAAYVKDARRISAVGELEIPLSGNTTPDRVIIRDANGPILRVLAPTNGRFIWDGTDQQGRPRPLRDYYAQVRYPDRVESYRVRVTPKADPK